MPGKKTREQRSERTGRTASDAGRKKDKPVTQSTRFTAQQMQEIEKACKAKGWSISQLMLTATVEKAMAINQLTANRPAIMRMLRKAARLLTGSPPAVSYQGQRIDPMADEWRSWHAVDGASVDQFERALDNDYDGYTPFDMVRYDLEWNTLSVSVVSESAGVNSQAGTHEKVLEVVADSLPAVDWRLFLECLDAVAPDFAPVFREANTEALHTLSPREGMHVKFRKAEDLLRKEDGDATAE